MVRIGLLQHQCQCWHHTRQLFATEVKAIELVINGRGAEDCLDQGQSIQRDGKLLNFFTDFRFRAWTVAPRGGK